MAAGTPDPLRRASIFDAVGTAEFLDDYFGGSTIPVRRLPTAELRSAHPSASAGWRIDLPIGTAAEILHVVIDSEAPYSRPGVYLANVPRAGRWPHVESDGRLCLATEGTGTVSRPATRYVDVVDELLKKAQTLLDDLHRGGLEEDFLTEWPRYWVLGDQVSGTRVLSLVDLRPPSRVVFAARWDRYQLFAETAEDLRRWVRNRDGKALQTDPSKAPLLFLSRPLAPREYPQGVGALVRIARREGEHALNVLHTVAAAGPRPLIGLLVHVAEGVPTLVAFEVPKPGGGEAAATHGFRPGNVPPAIREQRYLGHAPVLRAKAARADPAWVHGRDANPDARALRDCKVTVIGCGSLGGGVTRLLVQAGIGHICVVDDDVFDWPNSGRHILGADAVDRRKGSALVERLRRDFPHVNATAFDERWQEVFLRGEGLFDGVDLVIAATGEWASDAALSDLQQGDGPLVTTPVVYGWLERHGHAAHAVLLGDAGGPCLRCGFTATGAVRVPVTTAPDAIRDARCGEPDSPHGATAVLLAQAFICDLGLDALAKRVASGTCRVWIAPRRTLVPGTAWSDAWRSAHGDPGEGGRLIDVPWLRDPECPTCGL